MKIALGEIFEIKTKKGLAYIQYVNKYDQSPFYGDLIRVLDGYFNECPIDFKSLVQKKELFYCFAPLHYRNQQSFLTKVSIEKIPDFFKKIPPFRVAGVWDKETRIVQSWGIFENGHTVTVGKLPSNYLNTPTLGTWNMKAVINAIERGYLPRKDIQVVGKVKGISIED